MHIAQHAEPCQWQDLPCSVCLLLSMLDYAASSGSTHSLAWSMATTSLAVLLCRGTFHVTEYHGNIKQTAMREIHEGRKEILITTYDTFM